MLPFQIKAPVFTSRPSLKNKTAEVVWSAFILTSEKRKSAAVSILLDWSYGEKIWRENRLILNCA